MDPSVVKEKNTCLIVVKHSYISSSNHIICSTKVVAVAVVVPVIVAVAVAVNALFNAVVAVTLI